MKSTKILVVIVIALIAINCVLIGMLWFGHFDKKRPPAPIQGQPNQYLIRELNLTPDQVKKYDTLRQHHMEFTRQVSEEQRMQRDTFFDNLKNPKADMAAAMQLEKRIMTNQGKLDSATFYHFRAFRALLTPNQAAKFDGLANNVLHMMAQPHHGGPQGGQGVPDDHPMGPQQQAPQGTGPGRHNGHRPPPGRLGPDGRPMHPPPGATGPDGRPMHGPPPGEGGPPFGLPDGRPPGGGPPPAQ